MAKAIKTVADVKEYAMSKYNEGGDVIIECYDDAQIEEFIEMCGKKSVRKALDQLFADTNTSEDAEAYAEVLDTEEEVAENTEGTENPTEDEDFGAYVESFERANRCTVQATENGYVAKFYRTHKYIVSIEVSTVDEDGKVCHSNEAREKARVFAIGQCPSYEIYWSPEYQEQAWERKYKKYATDEQAFEDAETLMNMALTGVADKMGYEWSITADSIYAKDTNLGYIEDGKYMKDGCWAWADIWMTVTLTKEDTTIDVPMVMDMVSGQIKKCKLTQALLSAKIQTEQDLQTVA